MIADPAFYAFASLGVLIIGIAKGGLGGGIGILGVPLIALVIGPVQAAAILLPILLVMDAFALQRWWGRWDLPNLRVILPGAVGGIVLGTFTFRYLSDDHIRILLGVIALGFVASRIGTALRGTSDETGPAPANPVTGSFWGAVAGFTSFGVHAGGPPINVYLLRQGLDKGTFQATTVAFFGIVNWVKMVPYGWLGQLDGANLATSAALAPLAPFGIWLGAWLHHRIDERWFFRIVYASLLVVGLRLIWLGLS